MNLIRQALLSGRRRPRRTGAGSPLQFRGDGYEFVELRQYVAGDDVRRIDWAATARTGELQTRVVLEDVALTMAAIVDTSPSMQAGRRRALAHAAQEIADEWFAAAVPADRCWRVANGELVKPAARPSSALLQSCSTAAAALPHGSALLIVSDFYDLPQDDDLMHRLGVRFDCTALIATDPWRDGLPLSGFIRVRDSEDNITRALFIGRKERDRYYDAVRKREQHIIERLQHANFRTGMFSEADGAIALQSAFGFR